MVMPNLFTGPSGVDPNQLNQTLAKILAIRRENLQRNNEWETLQREGFAARQSDRRRERQRQEDAWVQEILKRERASKVQAMAAGPGVQFGGNIGAAFAAQPQLQRRAQRPRTAMGAQPGVGIIGFERPQERLEQQSRFAQAQEPPGYTALREDIAGSPDVISAQAIADEYVDAGRITSAGASRVLQERFDTGAMQPPGQFRPGIFGEDPTYGPMEAWVESTDIAAGFARNPLQSLSTLFGMDLDGELGFHLSEAIQDWKERGRSPSGVTVDLPLIGEVDIVREGTRALADLTNLLPVVGAGSNIARFARTGQFGSRAAVRAALAETAQGATARVQPVRPPQIPIPPRPTAEALRAQATAAGTPVSMYPIPPIQRAPTPSPIPAAPPVAAAVEPTPLVPRAAPTAGELMAQTPAIRNVPGAVEEVVEAPALAGGAGRFEMEPTIRAGGVAATDITPHGDALTLVKKQAAEANETVPAGVVDALDYAATLREADAPQLLPNLLDRPGPIAKGRALITRIRGITQRIAETNIAAESTRAHLLTRAFGTRQPLIDEASRLFGKDVVFGNARSSIARNFESLTNPFQRQAADNLAGSILHILQHPQLYNLSDAQRAFILELNTRNNDLLHLVQDSYGVKIGQLEPDPGAAFLSHIDTSPAARKKALDERGRDEIAHIGGETSQERIYLTAQDRMAAELERISTGAKVSEDALFEPSVNLVEILERMDFQKASMASAEVYRAGIGGQTRLEVLADQLP
ncbi:MAG TPA: hypothetical protein DG761_12055 [Gammaproteobacteria bacterium]|nr:hypothetical protein [Gammaproteobacteria bacterium]